MSTGPQAPSARRDELLELAYAYVLRHGLTGVSLRPLAAAVGSSPRVLLYLFGSKDGLVQALLERARAAELALLDEVRTGAGLAEAAELVWTWLAAPGHRDLLRLWVEGYGRSLVEPDGPWAGFARRGVEEWLAILGRLDGADAIGCTAVLALLRGALLDLLATGDADRTSAAVRRQLTALLPAAQLDLSCGEERAQDR